ncbi:MAG TPA: HNH endonuclease [Anaeromyxobacteraceae bacterium]|nr:HNH endonuclease [Anaeromyxobacteraceae bacterium]
MEAPVRPPLRARTVTADPLTADLRRLHVTVSRRFLEKLEAARAALSHSHAGASAEEILESGLDLLLERSAKRRGLVVRPRKPQPAAAPKNAAAAAAQPPQIASAYVPAHVKREVWTRDRGRCQWPLASGGVCGATLRLEIDHVIPRALGGPSTIGNTRLLCKTHNQLAARRSFGDEWMDRFTRIAAAHAERSG